MNIQAIRNFIFLTLFCFYAAVSLSNTEISIYQKNGAVLLNIKLEEGSKTYWKHSGSASFPTKIHLENISNLKSYDISWPWPSFQKNDIGLNGVYTGNLTIPIYLTPETEGRKIAFILKAEYLICNDSGCFPKEYRKTYEVDPPFLPFKLKNTDTKSYIDGDQLVFEVKNTQGDTKNDFILVADDNILFLPNYVKRNSLDDQLFFSLQDLQNRTNFSLHSSLGYKPVEVNITNIEVMNDKENIIIYVAMAILGGFILNFMPCVLPVLSIKLYSFANSSSDFERKVKASISFATTMAYFSLLAVITILSKKIGNVFIAGFSLQEPSVITLCIIVVTVMLSVMREKVALNIPQFANFSAGGNQYLSTCLSTIVSLLLATPCTAPFLATSMTFAITQPDIIIFIIMISAGVGFGFPYLITIFIPSFLHFLPKSGRWQGYLKFFFSILLVGTIIWLIWLLNSLLGIYAAFLMMFLVYILRFIIEFEFEIKRKWALFFILLICFFKLPTIVSSDFQKLDDYYEGNWHKYDENYVSSLIGADEVVLLSITADWCITCQVNKFLVLDSIRTINLMNKYKVSGFIADLTRENKEISNFMKNNNVSGIPFTIIYGPKNKKGIVLPVLFDYKDLEGAILSVIPSLIFK